MWFKKHINPIWNDDYKNFSFIRQPLKNQEELEWRKLGYSHTHFTGQMYDSTNPMPDYCNDIAETIGMYNCGYVFYKMTTGVIMPTHVDHFSRYCEIFNVEKNSVWRAIIFLEDWSPGHYFEIDNHAIVHYKQGDYVVWSNETPHAASNIGIKDRYTLQITGLLNDS